jgi:molybdopterin molybdotransferase
VTPSVAEALARTLALVPELPAEPVALAQARGRVLRQEVCADRPQPAFDRAAMDGFALRAADATTLPCTLPVAFEVRAGQWPELAPPVGALARIMTGAPVPSGADAVVPVERTRVLPAGGLGAEELRSRRSPHGTGAGLRPALEPDGLVVIEARVEPGQHVAPRGSEVVAGDRLLSPGRRLDAAALAVLASVGVSRPLVGRRPRIALLVTGDEIVAIDAMPGPAQIRNSNGPAVAALAEEAGAEVIDLGTAPDDAAALERAIARGLAEADVVITSGGVSAGDYDLVEPVLLRLGVALDITRVAVKPGAPLVVGHRGACLVFGLPGNPVSAQVTFDLFVRPALLRMQGARELARPRLFARASAAFTNRSGRENHVPARVRFDAAGVHVRPLRSQGSGDLCAHARANAVVVLDPARTAVAAGETVPCWLLPEFEADDGEEA